MSAANNLSTVEYRRAVEAQLRRIDEIRPLVRAHPDAAEIRIQLVGAYSEIAILHQGEGNLKQAVATRRVAIGIAKEAGNQISENLLLRAMLGTQLNGLGFTLREMEDWEAALAVYTELADLLEDGGDGSAEYLSLMAMAQDGIGDIQDTLGNPDARDDAWERSRILFQSCIHADSRGLRRAEVQELLDDVISKQNEFR